VKVFEKVEGGRYKVGNEKVAGEIRVGDDNEMKRYKVGDVLEVACKKERNGVDKKKKMKVKMEARSGPLHPEDCADFSVFMHAAAMVLNDKDEVLVLLNGSDDFIALKYILVRAVREGLDPTGLSDYIKGRFVALTRQDNVKKWTNKELKTLSPKFIPVAMAGGIKWMKDELCKLCELRRDWIETLEKLASAELKRAQAGVARYAHLVPAGWPS
jgi:hypothetical protein